LGLKLGLLSYKDCLMILTVYFMSNVFGGGGGC
jgi:hypothetical protein